MTAPERLGTERHLSQAALEKQNIGSLYFIGGNPQQRISIEQLIGSTRALKDQRQQLTGAAFDEETKNLGNITLISSQSMIETKAPQQPHGHRYDKLTKEASEIDQFIENRMKTYEPVSVNHSSSKPAQSLIKTPAPE